MQEALITETMSIKPVLSLEEVEQNPFLDGESFQPIRLS